VVLLEIAAQGVRGVAPAGGRLTLRPGYNVLSVDGGALRALLDALLYPDPRNGEAVPRSSGATTAPARAGLTLVGNDGVTYRVVRDLAGVCQLHKYDSQRRSFGLVSQDLAQVGARLQDLGVPPRERFAALLSIAGAELPSRRASGPTTIRPAVAVRKALGPEQTRKKLTELRAELERAKSSEKLQYQLDGLQSKLFKLEEALKAGEKIRDGLAGAQSARAEMERAGQVLGKLGDVEARLAAFEKAAAKRDEGLARVADEQTALDAQEALGAPPPLWQDTQFLAGLGGGCLAVLLAIVGMAMRLGVGARYLALLDVPAFGYAGWVALRWIRDLEVQERSSRRRKLVEERERKIGEQYGRETADVRQVMKELELPGIGELRELAIRVADADAVAGEWQRRKDEWETKDETRGALEEKDRVEAALRQVEERLAGDAGGFIRDPHSVEAEISRLEGELAMPAAPAPLAPVPLVEEPALAPSAPGKAVDPIRDLLSRASAELSTDPAGLVKVIQERTSQVLGTLSAQRLVGCLFDTRGVLQVYSGGKQLAVSALPPADADLFYSAVKLALIERSLAGGKQAAVADDAFAGLPETARRVLARLLKQIARPGQLLHATTDASFREAADHAA
jgi:hypothetical protein